MPISRLVGLAAALLVVTILLASCGGDTRADSETWEIEGPLLAWDAGVWIVDAVPIVVPDDVSVNGGLILGSTVTASGGFDAAGRRVAETISLDAGTLPDSTLPDVTLAGTIEHINGNLWIVDGREVVVANGIPIRSTDPDADATALLQIGNIADVVGNQLDDDRIVARDIVLRPDTGSEQPTPVPPLSEVTQPDTDDGGNDSDDDDDDVDDDDERTDRREKPGKPDKDDDRNKKEKP